MHNVACLCNLGDAGKQGNGGVFGNCLFGQALEDGDLHIPKKITITRYFLCAMFTTNTHNNTEYGCVL